MRRTVTTVLTATALAASTVALPALSAADDGPVGAPTANAVAADVDLDVGEATSGTGVLPNFAAAGDNLVRLQVGAFDPLVDPPPVADGVPTITDAMLDADASVFWLVQVADADYAGAIDAILAADASIVQALPETTYVVRATPSQRAAFADADAIRWTGYYQPAWKLPIAAGGRDGIMDLEGHQRYRVYAFRQATDAEAVGQQLAAMEDVLVEEDARVVVDVVATRAELPAIAAIPQVEWIATTPVAVPLNAEARWVNDTGIRDLYDATADGRLTGAGQTAAVADSGLNYTIDLNGLAHVDFRDCDPYPTNCKSATYTQVSPGDTEAAMTDVVDNATDHRKMVAFFDLGGAGPSPRDDSAHGSHVSGSVAADANGNGTWDGHDGIAVGANFVFQSVGDPGGGLGGLPADDYQLWRQAYRPRDPGGVPESYNAADYANYLPLEDARTHNNSYGLIVDTVDEGSAMALDQFVWEHEDMVVVVSAGNSGPNPASIGSPSVAKNNLTSAASANGRQPMASIDSIASFSSHGPTGDGRLGPDLATPGQTVISTKGGTADEYHYLQGTSMSGPLLTGLATLVRQYFWDGYADGDGFAGGAANPADQHNPSAALVRAALTNGAERMRGAYSGDDGGQSALNGQWPSMGQGYGLVNLSNSLYFPGDTRNAWFHDVWRADTEAFPPSDGTTTATRTYSFDVAPGEPLDVTLAWTDAPTGLAAGTPALINDLNLVVSGPNGETYVGNNFNSRTDPTVEVAETPGTPAPADARNVVERIRVADPAPGTYTIEVSAGRIQASGPATQGGRQGFALAATGIISPAGTTFTPGPALQVDEPGAPVIDPASVRVENISADTTIVRFSTNEPTTGTVTVDGETFTDVYNADDGGAFATAYDTGTVETSDAYANRPVVSVDHEVLVFGLDPGTSVTLTLGATDLAANPAATVDHTLENTALALQPQAGDQAMLTEASPGGWRTSTQLYVGRNGGTPLMGVFGMDVPASVDVSTITGATVELTGMHVLSQLYDVEPTLTLDLLDDSVEGAWGSQLYEELEPSAQPAAVQVNPETKNLEGGQQVHAFTFQCNDLETLKANLDTNDFAAFRLFSEVDAATSLPSWEFGFNRRSRGPQFRPRLVLYTADSPNNAVSPCDPTTPAPTVSDVAVATTLAGDGATVHWKTDVPSNSMVVYREQGTTDWIQVGTPALTERHQVQVTGLDPGLDYEFGVRSVACNGRVGVADNGGAGWDFFYPPTPEPTYDWYHLRGGPDDQQQKSTVVASGDPDFGATLETTAAGDTDPPATQQTTPGANDQFAGNFLAAWWYGTPFAHTFDNRDVRVELYLTGGAGAGMDIQLWKDVATTGVAGNEENLIGTSQMNTAGLGPAPTLFTAEVPVDGTVTSSLMLQVIPSFLDDAAVNIHYNNSATPSRIGIPTGPPVEDPRAGLPRVGPVPPPSAEATGLDIASVPIRALANDDDRAHGTGAGCVAPENLPPVAVPDAATTDVDTPVTIDVLANDSDPDGDDLTIADASSSAAGGTVDVAPDGSELTYTPPSGYEGLDQFAYTVDDGNGGTDVANVTVTVGDPVFEVTSASPSCATWGSELTITGSGFGPTQGSNFPVLAGEELTDVVSWSDTEVVAVVPSGRESGYAGVVIDGVTSNG